MRHIYLLSLYIAILSCSASFSLPAACLCSPKQHCGCLDGNECSCPTHQQSLKSETNQKPSYPAAPCRCTAEGHCGCFAGKDCSCSHNENTPSGRCHCHAEQHCGCFAGEDCSCSRSENSPRGIKEYPSPSEPDLSMAEEPFDSLAGNSCPCIATETAAEYSDIAESPSVCRYCWPQFKSEPCCEGWPCYTTGGWLPERPPLFRPFIADPREPTYSAGWRFNDNALAKNIIDVSYYDTLPVYGWCNFLLCGDKMQIDVEGALWAVFDPCAETTPLINADYYVGIPITYAYGPWSYRLRFFHISSHLGDEFLLLHPGYDRRNPSAEYLDFCASYQCDEDLRFYAGVGWVIQQDDSFKIGNFYAEGGMEARICPLGCYDRWDKIYGVPFIAMYFRYKEEFTRHCDATYALGYEVGKKCGLERRLRVYLEYHDGYSVEGQWSREPTSYLSLRAQYGF